MKTTDEDENELVHKVPHCQQRFNWDCGVSCVMMLLEEPQRQYFLQNFHSICSEEGFNQSTWTIDLCYLLKRFGIEHTMYTTMPGVNENYKKHSYYNKILDLDKERVRSRFAQAGSVGIEVRRRLVPCGELAAHVARRGPALLLVDAARLACRRCPGRLPPELRRWFGGGGYRGHYILVVGARGPRLLYRDPARACGGAPLGAGARGGAAGACEARAGALRGARCAPGTDHDTILVHRRYRSPTRHL